MTQFKVFIGFDPRQPLAYNVCRSSIERRTPDVEIKPLILKNLPMTRKGLTDFTYSRYLVPWLCGYKGYGLFLDSDMIVLSNLNELVPYMEDIAVVKHPKLKFEWTSMILFNNEKCKILTPLYVESKQPQTLEWASQIGELSSEWNHCVGYDKPRTNAKIVHFTQGIPYWLETKNCEYSKEWFEEYNYMTHTVSWIELMGNSVHARPVWERLSKNG